MRKRNLDYTFRFIKLEKEQLKLLEHIFGELAIYNSQYGSVSIDLNYSRKTILKRKIKEALTHYPQIRFDYFFGKISSQGENEIVLPKYILEFIRLFRGKINFSFIDF